jgi:hypothetical protein
LQDRNAQLAETTANLQEEKLRLDALLVRQYNLVAVLGRNAAASGRENGGSGSSPDNSSASREGLTLGEWLVVPQALDDGCLLVLLVLLR